MLAVSIPVPKCHRPCLWLVKTITDINNRDRTLRIDGVLLIRLTLIRYKNPLTIRREGHHVW